MPGRILVVDDDRVTLTWLTRTLQRAGYTVASAQDAQQGVSQAHRELPELVITDLSMPAGGGVSVVQRLALSSRTGTIPVVVLTGSQERGMEERAREMGVVRFPRKPCPPAVVLEAVATAPRGEDAPPAGAT